MTQRTRHSCGLYIFLVITAIACLIISGGCGGSSGGSSSVNSKNSMTLAFDTDKDGVPDIFDAFPKDGSRSAYTNIEMNSKSAAGAGSITALSVPCTSDGYLYAPVAKSVDITSGDEKVGAVTQYVEDSCQYSVSLDGGQNYAMLFAAVAGSADVSPALVFDPKLVIKDAAGNEISYDVKSPEDNSNKDIIAVVFKAPADGKYTITLSDPQGIVDKTDEEFCFSLFEDDDQDGLPIAFISKDGSHEYTYDDLSYISSKMAECVTDCDDDDNPTAFSSNAEEVFNAALAYVDSFYSSSKTSNSSGLSSLFSASTSADTTSADIGVDLAPSYYESAMFNNNDTTYELGHGINAVTGAQALRQAVKPISQASLDSSLSSISLNAANAASKDATSKDATDGTGVHKPNVSDKFYMSFVDNVKDHSELFTENASLNVAAARHTLKTSQGYGSNIEYNTHTTTLVMKYERTDNTPYLLGLNQYELTSEAAAVLSNDGAEAFRKIYGDYFMAGEKRGLRYYAIVRIRTRNAKELQTVKAAISYAYDQKTKSADADLSSVDKAIQAGKLHLESSGDFYSSIDNVLKNCEISITVSSLGNVPLSSGVPKTIEELRSKIDEFVSKGTKTLPDGTASEATFGICDYYMLRFASIKGGEKIPAQLNVDSQLFSSAKKMSSEYVALSGLANAVNNISASDINAGIKEQYAEEYRDFLTDYTANLSKICSSTEAINNETKTITALKQKFQDFWNRYQYYLTLKEYSQQKAQDLTDPVLKNAIVVMQDSGEPIHTIFYDGIGSGLLNNTARGDLGKNYYSYSYYVNNDEKDKSDSGMAAGSATSLTREEKCYDHRATWPWGHHNWNLNWNPLSVKGAGGQEFRIVKFEVEAQNMQNATIAPSGFPIGKKTLRLDFESRAARDGEWRWQATALRVVDSSGTALYPFNWDW